MYLEVLSTAYDRVTAHSLADGGDKGDKGDATSATDAAAGDAAPAPAHVPRDRDSALEELALTMQGLHPDLSADERERLRGLLSKVDVAALSRDLPAAPEFPGLSLSPPSLPAPSDVRTFEQVRRLRARP